MQAKLGKAKGTISIEVKGQTLSSIVLDLTHLSHCSIGTPQAYTIYTWPDFMWMVPNILLAPQWQTWLEIVQFKQMQRNQWTEM